MYKEDWLLRQIKEMINLLIFLIVGKKVNIQEYISSYSSEAQEINAEINKLIQEKKIPEAEDILMNNLNIDNNIYGVVALGFFQNLNTYTDKELQDMNYSREDIYNGLSKIQKIYGYNIF